MTLEVKNKPQKPAKKEREELGARRAVRAWHYYGVSYEKDAVAQLQHFVVVAIQFASTYTYIYNMYIVNSMSYL